MAMKRFVQNNNSRAIAYYRYSSHSQNEASIDQQREEAQKYAVAHGYTIIKEYVDAAISGTTDQRPHFQLMLDEVKSLKPAVLILWKVDRLGRDRFDLAFAKKIIRDAGCSLHYVAEPTPDDSPEASLMEGMLESMAEYYSRQLQRNIMRGMYHNAERCLYKGHATLGYDVGSDKHYIINDREAAIVRRIYGDYISGKPKSTIIKELNNAGIKTKKGGKFNDNGMHRILTNRMYIGEYHYADVVVPGGVPAIISEDDFQRAQELLAKNRHAPKSFDEDTTPRFWLTNKLFCGKCGAPMFGVSGTGKSGKKHYYYACANQRKHHTCDKKMVRQSSIEHTVLHALSQYLQDPVCLVSLTASIAEYYKRKYEDNSYIEALEAELKEVEKSLANLVKALEQGIFGKTTKARMQELEAKQQSLIETIAKEKLKKKAAHDSHLIRRYLLQFQNKDIFDTETRDMVLDHFVDKIYLYDDDGGKVVITCHFDNKTHEYSLSPERDEVREEINRILHIDSKATGVEGFDHRLLGSTTTSTTIS